MMNAKEWKPQLKDPWAIFRETVRINFYGKLSDYSNLQKFLEMVFKEKESYSGSAALTVFEDELCKSGFDLTLRNLDKHLFSREPNLAIRDLSKPEGEAASPRFDSTLKVKVYMGGGWDKTFIPYRAPNLFVKVGIANASGDELVKQTKTKKNNWEEEFSFKLVGPEPASLSIKVYNHNLFTRDDLVGQITLKVHLLSPGRRLVPLLSKDGKFTARWLLMRFEFVEIP
ncbi:Phosphoinositide phospholipase C 5 [Cardamine amara subsp. amara]|uniref:Phosphoinositide phospholipase C 5 n=1 Tax=Cardamine amara subsp. amara TaxID=228776 RepID=A0ABD1AEI7_CARAN